MLFCAATSQDSHRLSPEPQGSPGPDGVSRLQPAGKCLPGPHCGHRRASSVPGVQSVDPLFSLLCASSDFISSCDCKYQPKRVPFQVLGSAWTPPLSPGLGYVRLPLLHPLLVVYRHFKLPRPRKNRSSPVYPHSPLSPQPRKKEPRIPLSRSNFQESSLAAPFPCSPDPVHQ